MGSLRRSLLTALPKVALSRSTRLAANLRLPRSLRGPLYRRFAARYGAAIDEAEHPPEHYPSLAAFFARRLAPGARPLPEPPPQLAWPCDGKVVSSGPLVEDRIRGVKHVDYTLTELVRDPGLAEALAGGTHAIVYLAPGDYHRVHAPFAFTTRHCVHVAGGLFPVNPGAVASIPRLFARNEREILSGTTSDGRAAAVLLVAALNVGDTEITCRIPGPVAIGDELGAFGLGSTVVALLGPGGTGFPTVRPETAVRCRAAIEAAQPASNALEELVEDR